MFNLKKILSIALITVGIPLLAFAKGNTLVTPWELADKDKMEPVWWSQDYASMIFSSLLYTDDNLIPDEGDLAEKREFNAGENKYTFHLRNGLTWHDGKPLTTADVQATLRTALINSRKVPIIKSAVNSIKGAQDFIEGKAKSVSGITVKSKTAIEIQLAGPNALFLQGLSMLYIMPKHEMDKYDPVQFHLSDFWNKPIGSGPFKVAKRVPRDFTELVPFDNYYAGKPKIERVLFRPFMADKVAPLKAGELDWAATNNLDDALALKDTPHVETIPLKNYGYLRFLLFKQDERWMPQKVRKALWHAVDRKAIAEQFFKGYAAAVDTNSYPGYWVNPNLETVEYNPKKAKQLLKEAGWDGSKEISLRFYYKDQTTRDLMATIQQYWAQVGVKSNPRLLTGDVTGAINDKRDYDVLYAATGMFEPTDHYGRFLSDFDTGSGHKNPWFDEVHQMSKKALDPEKRRLYYWEAQRIMHEAVLTAPLYTPQVFYLQNKRVKRPASKFGYSLYNSNFQYEKWELTK